MKTADILLALLVTAIWGFNFVVIKVGLGDLPPLLFVALRFSATAFPAVFFVRRNNIAWKYLLGVGLSSGVAQFGFLYIGMNLGMPPGLSSLIIQSQVIFTFLLSVFFLKDHPGPARWLGVFVAFLGYLFIASKLNGEIKVLAFLLVLFGGFFWAIANIIMKQAKTKDMLQFMIWMSLIPPIPLLLLSAITESGQISALMHIKLITIGTILFTAWGATILGYGLWGKLIHKYSPNVVAPFSLLVPIFGILFSFISFNEKLGLSRIIGGSLVMLGIVIVVWQKPKANHNP